MKQDSLNKKDFLNFLNEKLEKFIKKSTCRIPETPFVSVCLDKKFVER